MKTSLSKLAAEHLAGGQTSPLTKPTRPLYPCDALLWIGDTEHLAVSSAWRTCRQSCDSIAIRPSLRAALTDPPRHTITHLIIAQTNRHERDCWAIDGPDLAALRECFADAKTLVLRGPLVAPTVRLPASADSDRSMASLAWVDSVATTQAAAYLPQWFLGPQWFSGPQRFLGAAQSDSDLRLRPVVIVASRYEYAESLVESLSLLFPVQGVEEPLVQWQREFTQRSGKGFATILWDDSVAHPDSTHQWQRRCSLAPHSRHVWMTSMATPRQHASARDQGVYEVFEKPGRLESLVESLHRA